MQISPPSSKKEDARESGHLRFQPKKLGENA
jgi:hypothetical protein